MFNPNNVNSQLSIRALKRQVTTWVEGKLPNGCLEAGTAVIVMEVSCNAPGCVPLETAVMIVFPHGWVEGIVPAKVIGDGTYRTKILKPMAEVDEKDVESALPPELGGTFDPVRSALDIRDSVLASIDQKIVNADDKGLVVEFLRASLSEYASSGFKLPERGVMPSEEEGDRDNADVVVDANVGAETVKEKPPPSGNFVIKRPASLASSIAVAPPPASTPPAQPKTLDKAFSPPPPRSGLGLPSSALNNAKMTSIRNMMEAKSSSTLLSRLEQSEHPAGVRRRGCPCCDPDDPNNVADMMLADGFI